jgi:DNA-binding SARP family transcriptional activator
LVRVYLTGRACVEHDGAVVAERRLAGPQGRVVLAMLAAEHGIPVSRERIARELWESAPPRSWENAIRVLISKLREALRPLRASAREGSPELIAAGLGHYQFNLPEGGFVDLDAASAAVHHAEAALAAGELGRARSEALTACIITRRPFLAGAEGPWARSRRRELLDQQARAREVLAEALLRAGDHRQAAREADAAVRLDPCREGAYRQLMRAYAAAGDRGLALRACTLPPGAPRRARRGPVTRHPGPPRTAHQSRLTVGIPVEAPRLVGARVAVDHRPDQTTTAARDGSPRSGCDPTRERRMALPVLLAVDDDGDVMTALEQAVGQADAAQWIRATGQPGFVAIRLVGDQWTPRSHEIRGLLDRSTIPYQFHPHDSAAGRQLLRETGQDAARWPVLMLFDGRVLIDPTNSEVAEAIGVPTQPAPGRYDVIVVGAGPAGLSAATYGASEGLRTLLLEPEALGGQAGTSSLIRRRRRCSS